MVQIASKLPRVSTTIFTVMSALAKEYNAINLSQGFPDYNCSEDLIALVNNAMKEGHNQYAPMPGVSRLKQAIAQKINLLYQAAVDPGTEITITPGATYAIYTAITTVIRSGDEVIVFEPAYDSYIPNILLNGGIPVLVPLQFPDYRIDWSTVRKKLTPRTRMIIVNSPHNPTGTVLTAEDMKELEAIIAGTQIILLSDEVYEHLVYDGREHQSVLKYPALRGSSFAVFSFGKAYHNTGWKMGYCVAGETLMKEFRKVHQFLCFSVNTPMQYGIAAYLQQQSTYLSLPGFFQQKRDHFLQLLRSTGFEPLSCQGSYFLLVKYNRLSREEDRDFAIRLTKEFGVASIPVSVFYQEERDDKVLRFCFAKKQDTLDQAAARLRKVQPR